MREGREEGLLRGRTWPGKRVLPTSSKREEEELEAVVNDDRRSNTGTEVTRSEEMLSLKDSNS